jgi:hypothetical protein
MTAGFGSEPESFDDFIAHFFGGEPGDPRQLTYQVDIARLMSAPTSRGDEVRIAVADDELTFSTAPAG